MDHLDLLVSWYQAQFVDIFMSIGLQSAHLVLHSLMLHVLSQWVSDYWVSALYFTVWCSTSSHSGCRITECLPCTLCSDAPVLSQWVSDYRVSALYIMVWCSSPLSVSVGLLSVCLVLYSLALRLVSISVRLQSICSLVVYRYPIDNRRMGPTALCTDLQYKVVQYDMQL